MITKEFRDQVAARSNIIRPNTVLDDKKKLYMGRNFKSPDFQQRLLAGHLISIHVGDEIDPMFVGLEQLPATAQAVQSGHFDGYISKVLIAGQALDYQIEKTVDFH